MTKRQKVTIGSRYFKLIALEQVGKDKNGNTLWRCQCDCGKEAILKGTSLTMRSRPTKSCGCLISETHTLVSGLAAANALYRRYMNRDRNKKRLSDISSEDFLYLTQMNCYYCDKFPTQEIKFRTCNGAYTYNGLDRRDNSLGYTKVNSVACCKICNSMKLDMSEEDFLNHLRRVSKHVDSRKSSS